MKKKVNILLLILVLGVWGTVIYKFVSQYLVVKTLANNNQQLLSLHKLPIRNKDTFELKPLKRDPFLNKNYASAPKKIHNPLRSNTRISIKKNNQPSVPFPTIYYLGYIKPLNGNAELILIKVNGKLLKLKSNEVKDGIKVVRIFKDSIKVSFNKEVKIIKK